MSKGKAKRIILDAEEFPLGYIPYKLNDHVSVTYELQFGRDLIKPGSLIKFKHERGLYSFSCVAHHAGRDTTWIDCRDITTGAFHSFDINRLKGPVVKKRSRRKKVNAG